LHDRQQFHVAAYSYGPDDGGAMRARLLQAFDEFHDVRALSDRQIAEKIAADGIDILIDLKGYTRDARAGILALRPAPLQVNYLGYPATLGAHADYLVADAFLIPPEHRSDYSEAIAYLPRCYQPNDGVRMRAPAPARAQAGLPDNAWVLAAFHQTYKLNPALWAVWCEILRQTDDAVLWLLATSDAARANLIAAAVRDGIDPARLIFAPKQKHAEHLARLACADLLLDAFPVNGHTSVSDALWAGVPVLTCAGATFISRVAGSLLHTAGLGELVAVDLAQYRELALALAADRPRLLRMRAQVAQAIATGYLYDSAAYTRDWEALLMAMWQRATQGLAPVVLGPF
jgi:predicted O-linked N-acetylglucosamine transferase (SPINDLY family)